MKKKNEVKWLPFRLEVVLCWVGLAVSIMTFLGCGEDPQQLFETAQFEEQQQNRAHARELYERIIRDHAKSDIAQKAEARLKELQKEKL